MKTKYIRKIKKRNELIARREKSDDRLEQSYFDDMMVAKIRDITNARLHELLEALNII